MFSILSFMTPTTIAFASFVASVYMTGVIWLVQLVHYPLFSLVNPETLSQYVSVNASRTTLVVLIPMVLELFTALYLIKERPEWLSQRDAYISALLIIGIFASTFFLQVPLHNKMERTGDVSCIPTLVLTNWVRTILWTVRSCILGSAVFKAIQ